MPLSDGALIAVVERYETRLDALRSTTATLLSSAWDALDGYDESDIATFVRMVTPRLAAAQTTTVQISASFYSTLLELPPPSIKPAEIVAAPDLAQPFHAAWHALGEGRSFEEAISAGRSMAAARGFDVIQSTGRRTGDAATQGAGESIRGWRRVVSASACPWCATVAGQLYVSAESADFGHDRCDCSAVPVTGRRDPARAINRQRGVGD